MKATCKEPRCSNSGVLFVRLLPETPYNFNPLDDDRQMIAPAARMISTCLIPADGRKTTLSHGRRQALQFAAIDPEVNAVVARSPSHVRWEGATARQLPGGPVWTWRGQPLAYAPIHIPVWFAVQFAWDSLWREPVPFAPLFLHNLQVLGDAAQDEIPVENIHGPMLLLSGKDDQKWPSALMATHLMKRLQQHRHPYADRHLSYAGAGHWIPYEYLPTAGSGHGMIGGTPAGTARAQADSWPKILEFFIQAAEMKQSHP